jgi:ABC-2 type transport system permease protein
LSRALAFVVRDFRIEWSYRVQFLLHATTILASILLFYFLAALIDPAASPHLAPYGGEYFPFVLIGIALNGYLGVGLSGFANRIREAQTTGTFEAMLMTPTGPVTIAGYSTLWDFLFTSVQVALYLILGVTAFGVRLGGADWLAAGVALILAIASFAGLGLVAAAFIVVLKRGNPVAAAVQALTALLGGVFYPISILPEWLQVLSRLLPGTYALDAVRRSLLEGEGLAEISGDLGVLALFAVVLVPLGLWLFRLAVRRAMVEGTLTHY